jgi:hypothetical protein
LGVEGCRQRGFKIYGETGPIVEDGEKSDPVIKLAEEWNRVLQEALIQH